MKRRNLRILAMAMLAGATASVTKAQSISTIYTAGNGGASLWTVYFDVNVVNPMTITSFDVNSSSVSGTAFTLDVYMTAAGGTYVGNTSNPGAWTLMGSGAGTTAGPNLHSACNTADFLVTPGTYGLAVRYTGCAPSYTNGTGANQNYSNSDIALTLGASQATTTAPFTGGTPFTPRVWNGTVYYTLANVSGACCLGNGSCLENTPVLTCVGQGGVFQGGGSVCAGCPQPGACCMLDGSCSFVAQPQCQAISGAVFDGAGVTCAAANCPQPGACCVPSTLTCSFIQSSACTAQGGTWAGAGVTCATANCPTPGACCKPDGSCVQATGTGCASLAGVYHGDSSSCSTANICPNGGCCLGDGTCVVIGGSFCQTENGVYHGDGSTCVGAACLCTVLTNGGFESGTFSSWTQGGNTGFTAIDTGNFIVGVLPHSGADEAHFGPVTTPGTISQQVTANAGDMVTIDFWYQCQGAAGTLNSFSADLGTTNLIAFTNDAAHVTWTNFTFTVPAPTANPLLTFTCRNDPSYIFLDDIRACVAAPASCYANCDLSTTQPCLNVLDFSCFLNAFAAGNTYANCDNSTTQPVLNVLDFSCFLNAFAAGCSSC